MLFKEVTYDYTFSALRTTSKDVLRRNDAGEQCTSVQVSVQSNTVGDISNIEERFFFQERTPPRGQLYFGKRSFKVNLLHSWCWKYLVTDSLVSKPNPSRRAAECDLIIHFLTRIQWIRPLYIMFHRNDIFYTRIRNLLQQVVVPILHLD